MSSPYARPRSGGGSAYATDRSGSGGSAYATPRQASSSAAPKKSGGGILGFLGHVGHVIAQKSDLAARDIKGIPGGIVDQANTAVVQPWKNLVTTGHPYAHGQGQKIDKLISQQSDAAEQTLSHPGRDPFATALLAMPLLHGAGRVAVGGAEAVRVAKAASSVREVVRAAGTKPEQIPRALVSGNKATPLIPSRGGFGRVVQAGYDKVVQGALDKNEAGQATGPVSRRIAAHGQKRIGGALTEEAQIQQKMRAVPASLLDKAAGRLAKTPRARREQQAALELTSVNTAPEDAAAYHFEQAAKGVNPKQNAAVARLYQRVADKGLLTKNENGDVVVNADAHPKLAKVDAALARVQSTGDKILIDKDVRDADALKTRRDAPARVRAGATYEKPTPGKVGRESQGLIRARAYADRLGTLVDKAESRVLNDRANSNHQAYLLGPAFGGKESPILVRLKAAHSVAKDEVERLEGLAAGRVKPTGIVGGESARPGRGFVSARVSEKKLGKAEASASRGPVVGVAKSPIDTKTFTGRSIEQGLVPINVTASASRHFRTIVKFVNTDAQRRTALQTGSDLRRSNRDVLVREPDMPAEKVSAHVEQALGRQTSNVDTAEELATQEGLNAAHEAFKESLFRPGELKARFATDRSTGIGVKAPAGYKWVDRGALGDLAKASAGPRGKIARGIDTVNSAVTAATVYFKVGHVGTRVLTNATTNIIQGSAAPSQMKKSYQLWDKLGEEQRGRALAASGQHGFSSLPHEGENVVSRVAGRGAQWWAKHADAMFRFNSLAYELRKVGYSTPKEFTKALDHLESGGQGLPAHEWSKLSAAARRADREAISYGRLNDFEKRYLTRAVWFYPWIKGSTLFTVRTAIEHPFKAAYIGATGAEGRRVQEQQLGPTPSYEAGLVKLFGGHNNPGVADFSTFSPFATAADVVEAPTQPGALAGFLNPVAGAGGQFLYGLNQYGGPSKSPYLDALLALGAATPEQQFAEAYAARGQDQSKRIFHKSILGTLERYAVGPGLPRVANRSALAQAAARQASGRR